MTEWLRWLAIACQPQTQHGWTEGNRVLDLIRTTSEMSVAPWQIFAIIDDTSVMNFRKKLQHDFLEFGGGGSKAVWNFSENSSILEGKGVP